MLTTSKILKRVVSLTAVLCLLGVVSEECSATGQNDDTAPKDKYVEVCGIKWATGNLYYKDGQYGLYPNQWQCNEWEDGYINHFNYGALTPTINDWEYIKSKYGYAYICQTEWDIAAVRIGTQWKLPSDKEFKTLIKKADIHRAAYEVSPDKVIEGMYFRTPKGKKRVGGKERILLTAEDLTTGLFLPFAGYRRRQSNIVQLAEYNGFYYGYYWSGVDYNALEISSNKVILKFNMFKGIVSTTHHLNPNIEICEGYLGLCIRPVYVGYD